MVLLMTAFILFTGQQKGIPDKDSSGNKYSGIEHFAGKKVHKLMRKHHIPAFAIAIVDNQEILYQEAFGKSDIENNIDASVKTVFKLWSIAKVFTAIEVFREVEEGLIDLDCSIIEYLPDFKIQSRNKEEKAITVKSILAHRSGLPRNECVLETDAAHDTGRLIKFERSTADCFMAYPVGYRYKYSNLGYDLLGRIIEENRGEGFSHFMKEHLMNDLGMVNSTCNSHDIADPEIIAKGYEFQNGKYYPMIQYDINSIPSGNLYSTIEDLSSFLKSVLGNGVFDNMETLSQMFIDHYSEKNDPETMGLGWKTTHIHGSELMVWHDGGPGEGIGALIALLPYRKLGIALIGNGINFSGNISVPFALEILDKMIGGKSDLENDRTIKPLKIEADRQFLKQYAGKYAAFGEVMDITVKNNKLKGAIGEFDLDLIPVDKTEFRVTHWMDKIGLTKIFKPPIDFNKIRIEFLKYPSPDSCYMIINMDNLSYEICPKYPVHLTCQGNWDVLAGEYLMAERLPCNKTGNLTGSKFNIYIEDSVLIMSGPFGPIVPLDDKHLIISSGPFSGEVIEYFTESGHIIHQNAVFIPASAVHY